MAWIEFVVRGAILAAAMATWSEWWRRGGAQRRDIALTTVPVVFLIALPFVPGDPPWLDLALLAILAIVPLLYMRLARHLEPLGPWPLILASFTIISSLAALTVLETSRWALATFMAAVIAPFLFTAVIMANATRRREGVARRRLAWTAINATTFAVLLLLLLNGLSLSSSAGRSIQVALAFTYVWAFATPGPVREAWRAVAFRRFVEETRGPQGTVEARLDAMRRAAASVVEAEAAYVLEVHGDDAVCVAHDRPFPHDAAFARRLVELGRDGIGHLGAWTAVGLQADGEPPRALAVRLRSDRLFPGEDEATLAALAQEIEGRFREAAYQQAQDEARRAAECLARFRSDYLRAVCHEIANPLSPIKVELSVLADLQGEGAAVGLERIGRSVGRIEALVRDIGAVSRLSAAKMNLDVMPVDLAAVIEETCAAYANAAASQGCQLDVDIEDALTVPGDAMRIQQILDNLLSNAVKYSPDGGRIRVHLARDTDCAEIAVEDHGLGMDADQRARLFSDYGRVHTRTAPHIQGTGMGLYIARQLARLHGGDIDATSPGPGEGTRFLLRLPLEGPPQAEVVIEQPPLPGPPQHSSSPGA